MIDADPGHVRSTAGPAGPQDIVRRMSLGITIAVLVQYALGMVVNLYVTVPARDQGGGIFTAIGRAFANGPVALGVHAGLGLLILLGTITLVIRSAQSRRPSLIWLSAVTLLAILGAAINGAAFVNSGSNGPSLGMAMLTGVALFCLVVTLYLTGNPGGATPPAVRRTAGQGSTGQDAA
jgi:hypothetical protein